MPGSGDDMGEVSIFLPDTTNICFSYVEQRGVIDVRDERLQAELEEAERRIRELRGACASLTYDLEQSLKERDRLKRHLNVSHGLGEERGD